jgi:6-phosphogluconolactonase
VDPGGKFVYVTNFFGRSVSAYAINDKTGVLTPVPGSPFGTGGKATFLTVDPTGHFIYVTDFESSIDANVAGFSINRNTGALTSVPGSPFATERDPFAVAVDPSGEFVYVASRF